MCFNCLDNYQLPSSSQSASLLNRGEATIPPPDVRLTSLFEGIDGGVPPVPFVVRSRTLHALLQWGSLRLLPFPGQLDVSLGRIAVPGDFLEAATSPPKDCVIMVIVGPDGIGHDVSIMRKRTRAFVTVYDLLRAVQSTVHAAERQLPGGISGYYNHGESLRRTPDRKWCWRGISEVQDETDVWKL